MTDDWRNQEIEWLKADRESLLKIIAAIVYQNGGEFNLNLINQMMVGPRDIVEFKEDKDNRRTVIRLILN
jgi:hypothetical protein